MFAPAKLSVLAINATLNNGQDIIHPVVLSDDTDAILVDTGLPGLTDQFTAALEAAGVPLERLTHIILTHSDTDHIGSLAKLLALCPTKPQVLCHTAEKPYVQCDLPPIRLEQMESSLNKLSGERLEQMTALVQSLKANYKNLSAAVTKTVEDRELLPCGIEVVYTPGHTPGHISLYLRDSKTLIAGDALNVTNGLLLPAPDYFTFDKAATKASLQKLAGYDIETVVCYHGGVYSDNVNQRIKELAE
jgi:glyoxylase-like metal-dependent hydrolase (beta-lactamase superfamily II)